MHNGALRDFSSLSRNRENPYPTSPWTRWSKTGLVDKLCGSLLAVPEAASANAGPEACGGLPAVLQFAG